MNETQSEHSLHTRLLDRLAAVVGVRGLITDLGAMAPYLADQRKRYEAAASCVVRPASTEEVAKVVQVCADEGVSITPQGGNTGLVAGGIPIEAPGAVVLNLGRMSRVRDIDPVNDTITVEAGCILQSVQQAAESVERLFPLSLGAEGSCQIGGNLSTNAGGIQVLRYGNARDLVLGLEVVLPDGRIWDGLRALRKDNTGYDLKQLFIGAEGTLGVITAAVLRLFPKPKEVVTAFAAARDVAAAIELLGRARSGAGEVVTSFELIPRLGLDLATTHVNGVKDPFEDPYDWYVLIELWGGVETGGLGETLEGVLSQAYDDGLVLNATLAASDTQRTDLWRIREGLVEAQKFAGGSIKLDVAVPISAVADFIERASAAVDALVPGIRPLPFGHLGDGNIHFNLSQPEGADTATYLARWDEVRQSVYDVVLELNGSISAEHGIGRLNLSTNLRTKSDVELDLMRKLKRALDPNNLMNPGKVLPG